MNIDDPHCTSCTDPKAFQNGLKWFMPPLLPLARVSGGKKGLCVGKFWPFHYGHKHLLTIAQQHCDELYVIVCDRVYHTPRGQERVQCIREECPGVYAMCIRDVYDPEDSLLWANLCKSWCRFTPDVVVTSEAYGSAWARGISSTCKHVSVDAARSVVPVSGTLIRSNPFLHWQYLPQRMRQFYCRRVVIIGSESTGKTTLAKSLAQRYRVPYVSEYGREKCEMKLAQASLSANASVAPPMFEFTDEDFMEIMQVQTERERQAAETLTENGLIICDTNSWATLIWYERYQRCKVPRELAALQQELYRTSQPTLYLMMMVEGSRFIQDGLRDGESIREEMEQSFLKALDNQHIPYRCIRGAFEQRENRAVEILQELLHI